MSRIRIKKLLAWDEREEPFSEQAGRSQEPVFRPLPRRSPMERFGAICALRMIEGERLTGAMVQRGDIRDHDLLTLVGLELVENSEDRLSPARLAQVLGEQRRRLEARGLPRLRVLDDNLVRLGKVLDLGQVERDTLRLAVVVSRIDGFSDLFGICQRTPQTFIRLIRRATGHNAASIQKALAKASPLRRLGLLKDDFCFDFHTHPLEMPSDISTLLLMPSFDVQRAIRHLLRPSAMPNLGMDDFSHLPDTKLIHSYLESALRKARLGVNVLIHGAPGTGKTEFVRALAAALGMQLYEVPAEDKDGDAVSGQRRFRAFSLAQNLLATGRNQLLLFDEVEDVFGRSAGLFQMFSAPGGIHDPDRLAKGWINQALESNPVPTVWVCNDIGAFDPAYQRSFDLVVEFRAPTRKVRQRIVKRYFPDETLSHHGIAALAELDTLPPAQIERAAKVVKALGSKRRDERDAQAKRIVEMSLRAMGHSMARKTAALPQHYDPAFLNTDRDLSGLIEGLRAGHAARLCLFGPPGTGKTALGHHLAQALDRPLHVKRASDLVSMWVGETEKNLARAFLEAGDEGAILLIDEADSFLQDRSRAQRSWEVSQVNEMLTQMEAFEGIFIASTNLVDSLDAASLRRFDFKIRFDCLSAAQRLALFRRVLGEAPFDTLSLRRIERLDRFTPGDMANALRQLQVLGQAPDVSALLDRVEAELQLKPGGAVARIGFVR